MTVIGGDPPPVEPTPPTEPPTPQVPAYPPPYAQPPSVPQQYTPQPYPAPPYSAPPYAPWSHPQPIFKPYPPPYPAPPVGRRRMLRRVGGIALTILAAAISVSLILLTGLHAAPRIYTGYADYTQTVDDIVTTLKTQAAALERGDEAGWLAPVDPKDPDLMKLYQNQFDVLRAFRVTSFQPLTDKSEVRTYRAEPKPTVDLTVYFGYCAQTATCPDVSSNLGLGRPTDAFSAKIRWQLTDGRYLIEAYRVVPIGSDRFNRPPWVDTTLITAVGARTTVATSAAYANRLPEVLALTEAAAANADRYARLVRPERYILYLAGPTEWKTWLAGPRLPAESGVLGYATPTSQTSDVVVINLAAFDTSRLQLAVAIRHELGHVVTLLGLPFSTSATPLLAEGIAEYIEEDHAPISSYYRLANVRQFVRSGQWNGDVEQVESGYGVSAQKTDLVYSMGYLTWRCLGDTYGEEKMFAFADAVLRSSTLPTQAAPGALGVTWAAAKSTCATFIRNALR